MVRTLLSGRYALRASGMPRGFPREKVREEASDAARARITPTPSKEDGNSYRAACDNSETRTGYLSWEAQSTRARRQDNVKRQVTCRAVIVLLIVALIPGLPLAQAQTVPMDPAHGLKPINVKTDPIPVK